MASPLKVRCPHCRAIMRLGDRSALGKLVRCRECAEPFRLQVKAPSAASPARSASPSPPQDELLGGLDSITDEDFAAPAAAPPQKKQRTEPKKDRARSRARGDQKPRKPRRGVKPELGEGEWPIKWIVVVVMIVVAFFTWAQAAAVYARTEEGWSSLGAGDLSTARYGGLQRMASRSLANFFTNAVAQIPDAPAVAAHTLKTSLWLIILFVVLEVLVLLCGLKARSLQISMARESREVPP